jgi:NAD(P)-dependent dehydrogenase (short-subunit alcohol dehydrogenase family)
LTQSVVLTTGCSSGIGKALSIAFHTKGYRVVATARHPETIADLKSMGMAVDRLDVTNHEDIQRVVRTTIEREGRIDILVNNAGFGLIAPMMDVSPEELLNQFQTNVFGPLLLIQAVAPSMRAKNSGMIINIGSISGIVATPFAGSYCASKAAVHMLSDALRVELAPFGIRVVCVQPGGIKSNFGNASNAGVQRIISPGSWYTSIKQHIEARAQESQSSPLSAEKLARTIVAVSEAKHPPEFVRIGSRSFTLPLLKSTLPTFVLDSIFGTRFGLRLLSKNR